MGVYYKLKKKWISKQTWFFVEFELDFYFLCSLQKSILKSNWFFNFLNLIFQNWTKKSSDNRYFKNQVEIDRGIAHHKTYMQWICIYTWIPGRTPSEGSIKPPWVRQEVNSSSKNQETVFHLRLVLCCWELSSLSTCS